jgi:hypothetical protein
VFALLFDGSASGRLLSLVTGDIESDDLWALVITCQRAKTFFTKVCPVQIVQHLGVADSRPISTFTRPDDGSDT